MSKIKIQAREIVRYAKRNKLKIRQGCGGWNNVCCARAVVSHMFGLDYGLMYNEQSLISVGLSMKNMDELECGFEDMDKWSNGYHHRLGKINQKSVYFKMGKNVARLAELNSD